MANALALAGGVLQENAEFSQRQSATGKFNTLAAGTNSVGFTRSARAARMHDKVIGTQQDRAFEFFAKRSARFFQHRFIGSGEVDEVIAVNDYRGNFCSSPGFPKE